MLKQIDFNQANFNGSLFKSLSIDVIKPDLT
jgi:hypothetical protein